MMRNAGRIERDVRKPFPERGALRVDIDDCDAFTPLFGAGKLEAFQLLCGFAFVAHHREDFGGSVASRSGGGGDGGGAANRG